jgi:NDP-sugar pyrophosphorylase family protein
MIQYATYLKKFELLFPELSHETPWDVVGNVQRIVTEKIKTLGSEYRIQNDIAIHKQAQLEEHVILKGPLIISNGCFVAAHVYLRAGVFVGEKCVIGPGCEVKSSILMPEGALAHFNFVGDSLIGSAVNMEAGSIIANHHNDRTDKTIYVLINGKKTQINSIKFGSMIGDGTKIGANAVVSPGNILPSNTIVKRLQLVESCG